MKALSARQITTCEESFRPRCRCRCHGAMHGVKQTGYVQLALDRRTESAHVNPCYCIEDDCPQPVHLLLPEVVL